MQILHLAAGEVGEAGHIDRGTRLAPWAAVPHNRDRLERRTLVIMLSTLAH